MTHLPLAFSIHHFISSVGADAGFASIIGLAILVLLYFAQARETATLRERADGAEQRAAQLEARLSQVAQAARAPAQAQPVVPRPVPSPIARPLANPIPAASPAAAATAGAGAPAGPVAMPSAPAGVGAPALTSATRLISLPAGGAQAQPQAVPAAAETDKSPEPVAASGPAPATAAGASATATALATPPAQVETGNGSGGDTSSQPLLPDEPEPPRRVQLRPGGGGGGARQMPPLRQPPSARGPSRFGRGLAALIGVLAVAAVIAVLLIVTGSGSKNKPSGGTSTSNAPAAGHKSKTKAFNKRAVTVTVLNGTGTAGLAARILSQVTNAGFKQGTATNAANATQTTSIVAYLPGQKAAAQQVAKTLKLGSGTVSPIDPNTESIACPQATCNVDVVVTVGQDLVGR